MIGCTIRIHISPTEIHYIIHCASQSTRSDMCSYCSSSLGGAILREGERERERERKRKRDRQTDRQTDRE